MKKTISILAFILTFIANDLIAQETSKATPLSQILTSYIDIKNALVNSDASAASSKAQEFLKVLAIIDVKGLSQKEQDAFLKINKKLKSDAQSISTSKQIEAQRNAFSSLSNNIYTLAKAVTISADPLYQQYCPMKKMYWLSNESAIKNPYYGSAMLTCGNVTDTLN